MEHNHAITYDQGIDMNPILQGETDHQSPIRNTNIENRDQHFNQDALYQNASAIAETVIQGTKSFPINKERSTGNIDTQLHTENELLVLYTEENSNLRVNEFQHHIENLIQSDPKRYSGLLKSIPRFVNKNGRNRTHRPATSDNAPSFPMISEAPGSFLLKFLRAANNNIENATKVLINYTLLIRDNEKYYRSILKPDAIQKVYKEKIHTVLPQRDRYRRRVFIWRPGKWNPNSANFTDLQAAMYMCCEMMAQEAVTQVTGCTVVCDGSNMGFKQLKSLKIDDIRISANFMQVMSNFLFI